MNVHIDIPAEWNKYYHKNAHFITYFGDIYHGHIVNDNKFPDRFFILSENQKQEFYKLSPEDKTLKNYDRLCWEIRDVKIIKRIVEDKNIGSDTEERNRAKYGNKAWKKMFIFGAGASYDCVFGENYKKYFKESFSNPPLAYEIFNERYDETLTHFEGTKLSLSNFEANGNDIEKCLEDEWKVLRNAYHPNITARHINLQFYMKELFQKISKSVVSNYYRNNLYSLFADKLQKHLGGKAEQVALLSFNYDTILDQFIEKRFDTPFLKMEDYIDYNNRDVLLFKPHGSCNWGWLAKNLHYLKTINKSFFEALYLEKKELWEIYYMILGDFGDMVHYKAWGYEKENNAHGKGRYTINKNKIEVMKTEWGYDYLPAMLMPYRDKDEFIMHYEHQLALEWYMGQMEELYIIGWKGNEDVFNRKLKSKAHNLKKIVIVNPNEEKKQEVSGYLKEHLELSKYQIEVVKDFETFVLNEMDKIF